MGKEDECLELKNIKYQTMLMNKKPSPVKLENDNIDIESFLRKEKQQTSKKPWSKLEKTIKRRKLAIFAEAYNTKRKEALKQYLFQPRQQFHHICSQQLP